nr:hypothetical protein [Lignipirellula cremea]
MQCHAISREALRFYDEAINLATFGKLTIRRGSHVEPTSDGRWTADLEPVGGPVLGPFGRRSEALAAERDWLAANWITLQAPRSNCYRTGYRK